jgi:hypothetical protein
MGYYTDNNFGSEYIDFYKQQIQNLWKNKYNISQQSNPESSRESSNILTAHILKKRKSVRSIDELSTYLNRSQADYDVNILEYWKVKLLNC